MEENRNRLQFVRYDEVWFNSKDEVINTINNNLKWNSDDFSALYGEPMIFRYGDKKNPNIILAVGSVGADEAAEFGCEYEGGKYFFIDLADVNQSISDIKAEIGEDEKQIDGILKSVNDFYVQYLKDKAALDATDEALQSAIDKLTSAFNKAAEDINTKIEEGDRILQDEIDELTVKATCFVEDTDSVKFIRTDNEDGSYVLSAEVILPKDKKLDNGTFIDNQLEVVKNRGLFYNIELTCNKEGNTLALYVNGTKMPDVVLPSGQYISQGYYDSETEKLVFVKNNNEFFEVDVEALIKEWDVENEKDSGVVLSIARNAKDTEWKGHSQKKDVLKASIKFSTSDGNLAHNENDGLYVSNDTVNLMYKGQPLNDFLKTLSPAENIVDSFGYDKDKEVFWIKLVGATTNRVEIPVSDFFEEYIADNVMHSVSIDLTKRNINGTSLISADVNIDKDDNFNILTENSNKQLKVVAFADKVKYGNTTVQDVLKLIQDAVDDLEDSLGSTEAKASDVDTFAKNIIASVGLNTNGTADTYSAADNVSYVRGKTVREDVKILDKKLAEVNNTVESNKRDADSEIAGLKREDTAIKNTADALEKKVDGLIEANTSAHTKFTEDIKTLVDLAEEHKDAYKLYTQDVTKRLGDTEKNVETANNNISAVEDRVTTIEGNMSSHNIQYEALASTVAAKVSATPKSSGHVQVQIDENKNLTVTENDIASEAALNNLQTQVNAIPIFSFENSESVTMQSNNNKVVSKVNVSGTVGNIIENKSDGLYAAADFSYDPTEHAITFNGKKYPLNSGSVIDDMSYNSTTGEITITFTKADGTKSHVKFNASQMFKVLEVVNNPNSGITLTLTDAGNGGHTLSAAINISKRADNMLSNENGELFVRKDDRIDTLRSDVDGLTNLVTGAGATSVTTLSSNVAEITRRLNNAETNIGTNEASIDVINTAIEVINASLETTTSKATANEGEISQVKQSLNDEISTRTTLSETVSEQGTHITNLENWKENTATPGINANKEAISVVTANLAQTDKRISERITSVETSLTSSIESVRQSLTSQITDLATNVNNINTDLKGKIGALALKVDSDMTQLRNDVTSAINTHKAAVDLEINRLNDAIHSLQTDLSEVRTILWDTRANWVARRDISNGLNVNPETGLVTVQLAPESDVNKLLTVTSNGIDYVANPIVDNGTV